MTYIIKRLSNDRYVGIYDTNLACYPIEGPELRAAGFARIEGSAPGGWFKVSELEEAERIAALLNEFHGDAPVNVKKTKPKPTDAEDEAAFAAIAYKLKDGS